MAVRKGELKEAAFIGEYLKKSPKKRIYELIGHFDDFDDYRERYKEYTVNLMVMMREHRERSAEADTWVKVQTFGDMSDQTFDAVSERLTLEQNFVNRKISRKMFPDLYEYRLVSTAAFEWNLMEKEYRILRSFVDLMKPSDRGLLIPYIRKEKEIADIAAELCVEHESANKKVYRIRKALLDNMLPWFKEYKIAVPAY